MTVRRQYAGAASAQTLTNSMTAIAGSVTISGSSGWPNGATGPFSVVVNRNTPTEEKMLCLSLSGTTLTVQQRGYDGTSAYTHQASESIEVCATSVDFDEANAHTSASVGVHGLTGAVVGTTDTQTLAGKTLVQPTISDYTHAQHTHTSVSTGGVLGFVSGAVNLTPGSSTVLFPHGAPFAPRSAIVYVTNYVGDAYLTYYVSLLDGTNVHVNFPISTSMAANVTSCTIGFTVFA